MINTTEIIMSAITEALLIKMNRENFNQIQFAAQLDIKPPLLCLILSGRRTPSLKVVKAIYRQYPDLVDILLK
jgi:transcriptional regulator with XRE-family HTH domain